MANNFSESNIKSLPFFPYVLVCLVLDIVCILAVIVSFSLLPPQVPLFYGLAKGAEQLAPRAFLVIPALASLLVLVINSAISLNVKDDFIKKVLILGAVTSTVFALTTTVKIMFLVGSF